MMREIIKRMGECLASIGDRAGAYKEGRMN